MNAKKIIPSGRRLTFFLIITLVVAVFFIGYNFYFIPGNQNIVQKNGFLILENISRNIKERNDYLQTAFENILKPDKIFQKKSLLHFQNQLNQYKLNGKIFYTRKPLITDNVIKSNKNDSSVLSEDFQSDSSVYLADVRNDSLFYLSSDSANVSTGIYVPADDFIAPSIANQKKELFESYLLLHNNSGVVYADESLGINTNIAADSLLTDKKESLFAGIKEIQIKGIKYKMFYYPFKLGNEEVQLCAFLKYDIYFKKLHQVPVFFIYPIIIILLLILIMMPLVKFYLMGKDEQVSYYDFILAIISFFAGSAIITIIIIQVLLLLAANVRTRTNLESLSRQIDTQFNAEIKKAYIQLENLDTLVQNNPLTVELYEINSGYRYNVSDMIKKYYKDHAGDTALYYNFNRITWVNAAGEQVVKGQIDPGEPVFTNVSSRSYFQVFHHSEGYPVPGMVNASFGFEPVNSLTNGDFSVIISKKNKLGNGWITTMFAPLYSVLKTILPPGYGFCITDDNGKVLLHSETNRSLQENLIDNADPSRQIKESIKSRQESFLTGVSLYGKDYSLHIKPIAGMPFHLVTFYDNGYVVPVNLRILSFSLFFCTISFAACLFLWFGFLRRRKKFNFMLSGPMYYLKWLIPKEKFIEFYVLGKYFLFINLLLQVIVIFTFKQLGISNYAVLVLTLMLPVNIWTGLYVINYRVRKDMPVGNEQFTLPPAGRIISAISFQLFINLLVWYGSMKADYPIQSAFIYFTVFFNLFLWLLFLLPAGTFNFIHRKSRKYLSQYAVYATLLIMSLTAWPASLYTWYAHNQEITQSVKKEQLYLADALRQRAELNYPYYKSLMALGTPSNHIDTMELRAGIYTIYKDEVSIVTDTIHVKDKNAIYEQFYFSIANQIGNNYYDPLLIPALRDASTDNAWHWSKENEEGLSFTYHPFTHAHVINNHAISRNSGSALRIHSVFPERYIFIKPSVGGLLLLLLVAGIVYGLYQLISFISYRLFLKKYIEGTIEDDALYREKILQLLNEYKTFKESIGQTTLLKPTEVVALPEEYDYYRLLPDSAEEYEREKMMFETLKKYNGFYDFIWGKFSIREKYMLLNYAQNGFINFKNTEVIHRLLQSGVFVIKDEEVKIFSASFRVYILTQKNTEELLQLKADLKKESTWQTFRIPFLVIILGTALFIFITQEQTFQRITALLTGVTTVFTLLMKFFTDGSSFLSSKK
jgi:hypothetical protein